MSHSFALFDANSGLEEMLGREEQQNSGNLLGRAIQLCQGNAEGGTLGSAPLLRSPLAGR